MKPTSAIIFLLLTPALFSRSLAAPPESPEPPPALMFWPPSPDKPQVQFLAAIKTPADITGNPADDVEPAAPGKPTSFPQRPYGLKMAQGKIYVCDPTAGTVAILDLPKRAISSLDAAAAPVLKKPLDIALAADGTKYVADTGLGAIVVFGKDDKFVEKFGPKNLRPVAVAVGADELFVADMTGNAIRVFDRKTHQQLRTLGPAPGEKPEFGLPTGLTLDQAGSVLFIDVIGGHLRKITPEGKPVWTVGGIGDLPGSFVRPKHIACDTAGVIYVVDNAFSNVQLFDKKGEYLTFFGAQGKHPGAMDGPTGICVSEDPKDLALFAALIHPAFDARQLIVVSNSAGPDKLSLYAHGQLKPAKTVADLATPLP